MVNVLVREALPEEYSEAARVTVDAYRDYQAQMSPAAWAEYEADLADVPGRAVSAAILVAEAEGELVGAVSYFPAGARDSSWLAPDWAYFRALGVAPTHRGLGVGRALTQACIDRARGEGAGGLGLHTTEAMPLARAMYERMGFVQYAEYDGGTWKYWSYLMRF
ncbi:MAG: GNAT family N-acetyltransferase [Candidatus Dormibacteria bacterium]